MHSDRKVGFVLFGSRTICFASFNVGNGCSENGDTIIARAYKLHKTEKDGYLQNQIDYRKQSIRCRVRCRVILLNRNNWVWICLTETANEREGNKKKDCLYKINPRQQHLHLDEIHSLGLRTTMPTWRRTAFFTCIPIYTLSIARFALLVLWYAYKHCHHHITVIAITNNGTICIISTIGMLNTHASIIWMNGQNNI